jgi:hypothetical protein
MDALWLSFPGSYKMGNNGKYFNKGLNIDHLFNHHTISKCNFGLRSKMSGLAISNETLGCWTTLFVEILFPFLLA